VNEAVFWWDDGTEQNVYIGTNTIEQSRFRFTGEAKIDKEWSAGYILEIGLQGHPSNQWNQLSPNSYALLKIGAAVSAKNGSTPCAASTIPLLEIAAAVTSFVTTARPSKASPPSPHGVRTTFGTSLWSIRTTSTISASPHA